MVQGVWNHGGPDHRQPDVGDRTHGRWHARGRPGLRLSAAASAARGGTAPPVPPTVHPNVSRRDGPLLRRYGRARGSCRLGRPSLAGRRHRARSSSWPLRASRCRRCCSRDVRTHRRSRRLTDGPPSAGGPAREPRAEQPAAPRRGSSGAQHRLRVGEHAFAIEDGRVDPGHHRAASGEDREQPTPLASIRRTRGSRSAMAQPCATARGYRARHDDGENATRGGTAEDQTGDRTGGRRCDGERKDGVSSQGAS